MPFLSLIVSNWRWLGALALIFSGWYAHTVWDGYRADKAETKAVDALGKGEAAITDFNSALDKVRSNDKANCANQPHGAAIGKLLY